MRDKFLVHRPRPIQGRQLARVAVKLDMCIMVHMPTHAQALASPTRSLDDVAALGKALADPGRLRIVAALRGRELCVCHLVSLLERDASTVSRHVGVLRRAGLVKVRREGRWVHCQRSSPDAPIWTAIDGLLGGIPELEADSAAITEAPKC